MRTTWAYERQVALGPGSVVFMFLPLAHLARPGDPDAGARRGRDDRLLARRPGSIPDDLKEAGVTHLPVVPRVLEKIHAEAIGTVERTGRVRQATFRWALRSGARVRALERAERSIGPLTRLRHAIADRLVLSKVRGVFGSELELVLTGAAPIATDVLEFFDACGVLVLEGYGLSETTAAATLNTARSFRFGTVGRPLPDVEVSVALDGEVLIRGPNVFAGYFKDEDATRARSDEGRLAALGRPRLTRPAGVPADHRPQEGPDHHLGRQEHLAGQPRDGAARDPLGLGGPRLR